jgi:hypothetical protein
VSAETATISNTEMIVIGTTGSNPSTIIPVVARVTTSIPLIDSNAVAAPGAGAGTSV